MIPFLKKSAMGSGFGPNGRIIMSFLSVESEVKSDFSYIKWIKEQGLDYTNPFRLYKSSSMKIVLAKICCSVVYCVIIFWLNSIDYSKDFFVYFFLAFVSGRALIIESSNNDAAHALSYSFFD